MDIDVCSIDVQSTTWGNIIDTTDTSGNKHVTGVYGGILEHIDSDLRGEVEDPGNTAFYIGKYTSNTVIATHSRSVRLFIISNLGITYDDVAYLRVGFYLTCHNTYVDTATYRLIARLLMYLGILKDKVCDATEALLCSGTASNLGEESPCAPFVFISLPFYAHIFDGMPFSIELSVEVSFC